MALMATQFIHLVFVIKRFPLTLCVVAAFFMWVSNPYTNDTRNQYINDVAKIAAAVKSDIIKDSLPVRKCLKQRNTTNYFQYQQYRYIYTPYSLCKDQRPFVLILVKSSVRNHDNRIGIRRTWGNVTDVRIKMVFFVGYNKLKEDKIRQEFNQYKDLAQVSVEDTYYNTTIKVKMAFDWVVQNCLEANYVFFVDDDYYVNIPNLIDYLTYHHINDTKDLIAGSRHVHWPPVRKNGSKWYVPVSVYPDNEYPPFLSGGSFVMDISLLEKIWSEIPFVKPFKLDDVFLGMVTKSLGIKLMAEYRFSIFYESNRLHKLFSSHGFAPLRKMLSEWHKLTCRYFNIFHTFYDLSHC